MAKATPKRIYTKHVQYWPRQSSHLDSSKNLWNQEESQKSHCWHGTSTVSVLPTLFSVWSDINCYWSDTAIQLHYLSPHAGSFHVHHTISVLQLFCVLIIQQCRKYARRHMTCRLLISNENWNEKSLCTAFLLSSFAWNEHAYCRYHSVPLYFHLLKLVLVLILKW